MRENTGGFLAKKLEVKNRPIFAAHYLAHLQQDSIPNNMANFLTRGRSKVPANRNPIWRTLLARKDLASISIN